MTSVVNLDYDWRACGGTNRTRWRVWILIWRSVVNCHKEIDEIESCWIFVIHGRVSRRINISSRCKDWPFKKSFLIFNSRRILKIFEDVLLGSLLIIRGLAMGAWKKEELLFLCLCLDWRLFSRNVSFFVVPSDFNYNPLQSSPQTY